MPWTRSWMKELRAGYKADPLTDRPREDGHIFLLTCLICEEPIPQLPLSPTGKRPRKQRRKYCSDECKKERNRRWVNEYAQSISDWRLQEL